MRKIETTKIAITGWVMLLPAGCVGWLGPVDLQWSVSQSSGMVLSKEIGVNVGGLTLRLAAGFVGPDLPIPISDISSVDVGVYTIRSAKRSIRDLALPRWDRFLRVREEDGDVLAYLKRRGRSLCGLIVIAREGDELVITRVRGNVDALIQKCLSTNGGDLGFDQLTNGGNSADPPPMADAGSV